MLNIHALIIERFTTELIESYRQDYGTTDPPYGEMAAWVARLALENIANSDMLYHNVEHTLMVASAGLAILRGKHLCEGAVMPRDWFHFMAAALCHDIGYVRGICAGDGDCACDTGTADYVAALPPGSTDAAITPYHVDRSKAFVRARFGHQTLLRDIDAELVASLIEMTRFPAPPGDFYKDTSGLGGLVRAADLVGQLGDPNYLRKTPALFFEFEQIGANEALGYKSPGDLRAAYARFYWDVVSPYVQDALRYLAVTTEGRQWIAHLHANVFAVEHNLV